MKALFLKIFLIYQLLSIPVHEMFAQFEPRNTDEQEIVTTYANYRYGFERFHADYILKNISAASIRFFDTVFYHVQYADSITLMNLPVSFMILVLDIRKKAYPRIQSLNTTRDLLDVMLNYGIIREDMEWQIADIAIKDTVAHCSALMPSSPKPKDLVFIKESDYWKLDLYGQYLESDRNFSDLLSNESLMKQYNLTKAWLYQQIFDKLGIPQGSSMVWLPVKSKVEQE